MALAYYGKGEFTKSKSILAGLINDTCPFELKLKAKYLLMRNLYAENDFQGCLDGFNELAKISNNKEITIKSEIGAANCLRMLNKPELAVKKLEALRSRYPGTDFTADIILNLADAYYALGQLDGASRYLNSLINVYPEFSEIAKAYYLFGNIELKNNNLAQAEENFLKASNSCKEESFCFLIINALADLKLNAENYSAAISLYKNFSNKFPKNSLSYFELSKIYISLKQFKDAENVLLLAEPKFDKEKKGELLFSLAQLFEEEGKLDLAITYYNKKDVENSKFNIKALLRLGKIFEDKDDLLEAALIYKRIIDLNVEESKYARERLELIEGGN